MENEYLNQETLLNIRMLKQKIQFLELQKYSAELELKNAILHIYVKHKLNEADSIDETTGQIKKQANI